MTIKSTGGMGLAQVCKTALDADRFASPSVAAAQLPDITGCIARVVQERANV